MKALQLLSIPLAFALVATAAFAGGDTEEPAAAAEKEMVSDPSTGMMVTAPEYGGTLTYATGTSAVLVDGFLVFGAFTTPALPRSSASQGGKSIATSSV